MMNVSSPLRQLSYACGLLVATLATPLVQAQPVENDGLIVEKVVMLMRHGVSAESWVDQIAPRSGRTLPDFQRADCPLSAHGRLALEQWGRYLRQRLAGQGVLPATGPLSDGHVTIYSSSLLRNRGSAVSLIKGLSPDGSLHFMHAGTRRWFEPSMHELASVERQRLTQAVMAGLGMSLEEAQEYYRSALEILEIQLELPLGLLSEKPWRLLIDDHGVRIKPLELADLMVDTESQRYAGNIDSSGMLFGGVARQTALARLASLRRVNLNATRHPWLLATRLSALLLAALHESLLSPTGQGSTPVIVYMGHDTNIAAIRSILGFNWEMPNRVPNDIVPGGTLMLERVLNPISRQRYVRVSYLAPTLDQIRHLQPFDDTVRPFFAEFLAPPDLFPRGLTLIPFENFNRLIANVFADIDGDDLLVPQVSPSVSASRLVDASAPWTQPSPQMSPIAMVKTPCGANPHDPLHMRADSNAAAYWLTPEMVTSPFGR